MVIEFVVGMNEPMNDIVSAGPLQFILIYPVSNDNYNEPLMSVMKMFELLMMSFVVDEKAHFLVIINEFILSSQMMN